MGAHIVNGQFQSDKYPTCPAGKVPLSVKDPTAQNLLWEYARRRRVVDAEFSADLEAALLAEGYNPTRERSAHAKLLENELNKVINRCLWKPSGDPNAPLLRRAAAAYVALKSLDLRVDGERDVVMVLGGENSTREDYLLGADPVPMVVAPR